MSIITAKSITKSYGTLPVLRGIELQIEKSEIVSIVGASGAGKTTLLTILGTLDRADGGELLIDGQDISKLNHKQISVFEIIKLDLYFSFIICSLNFLLLKMCACPLLLQKNLKLKLKIVRKNY